MTETTDDFEKWLAWARVNTHLFTQVSSDNGRTWMAVSDPIAIARAAWQAATKQAKKTRILTESE